MKKLALAGVGMAALASTPFPRAIVGGVRGDASDPKSMFDELKNAFEEFKSTHDEKLKSKADDTLVDEKLEKINATMSDIEAAIEKANRDIAAARLGNTAPGDMDPTDPDYVKAFNTHFRKGDVSAALSVGTDDEGGFLAPVEWDRTITAKLKQISPIRENAQVITTSKAGFKKLFSNGVVGSGWVGETAARPETTTPGVNELTFGHGEIYANPAATQQFLDDAAVNVEEWLGDEVENEFAVQENIAFLAGNGVNKPFGILTYVTGAANAAKHPFGAIKVTTAAAAAAIDPDELLTAIYDLPGERLGEAKFYMNRTSLGAMRKLKDADGNYLWQPSAQAGEPSTLNGYPIVDTPGMPDIAAGLVPILFGNMRMTYLVIDRVGIRVLRDPYTNKPFVHFYTTKRVGGGVQNPEYMRAVKMAAS